MPWLSAKTPNQNVINLIFLYYRKNSLNSLTAGTAYDEPIWNPTESEKEDILRLAQQIPVVWKSKTSTPSQKKRIVRILIEDVTVMAEPGKAEFFIGIRYRSGFSETLPLKKPQKRYDEVRHAESTISLIRNLSATMDDSEILSYLKQNRIITKTGSEFTISSIKWIRYKHKIPNLYESTRKGLTVREAADVLGISSGKVYYYIDKGIIPAIKQRPGWPWEISLDTNQADALKKILQ